METRSPNGTAEGQRVGTVVIGGGQAGLITGYYLQRSGEDFVVIDASTRIGDSWRQRWESLRLFTLPRYASLPGWRIPVNTFPTKDDMADYLTQYAARFQLPVRSGTRVTEVTRAGQTFAVQTDHGQYRADRVVIATGAHQHSRIPAFTTDLDPSIRQFHSSDYHRPAQFAAGNVLVVGAGNSGTDIALEAARTHRTWLAGRHPGEIPIDIDSRWARPIIPLAMFAFKHILTLRTPMGRAKRMDLRNHGVPLNRNKLRQLDAAGIVRVGRIIGTRDGRPLTVDGEVLDVSTVVWCTGYRTNYPWLRLPVVGDDGRPCHHRGIVDTHPGLYFIGLDFQFAVASATLQGLDRDARYIVRQMRRRHPPRRRAQRRHRSSLNTLCDSFDDPQLDSDSRTAARHGRG